MIKRKITNKPLLLVFPHNLLSHYLRCIVLSRHLSAHFEVMILQSDHYNNFIQEENLATFSCAALDAVEVNRQFSNSSFSWINNISLSLVLEDQIRVINELQPDLVLGDASFTLKMAAEIAGVPYVSLINGYMSKYYARVRFPSRSFPGYQLMKQLPAHVLAPLVRYGEGLTFRLIHEPFNRIRKRYGLEKKQQLLDELEGDITLLCDDPALFPQEGLPEAYFSIGPLFYTRPPSTVIPPVVSDNKQKTLCVSMGSSGSWDKMTFLNDKYFEQFNIIVAGDTEKRIHGPKVIHVPFFDAEQVFPGCELFICHGGNGSIYQSLYHGVPVLCLTTHMEQDWNVQALEKHDLVCSLNNLDNDDGIIEVVDSWMLKKQNIMYQEISLQIATQVASLPQKVEEVASFAANNFLSLPANVSSAFWK